MNVLQIPCQLWCVQRSKLSPSGEATSLGCTRLRAGLSVLSESVGQLDDLLVLDSDSTPPLPLAAGALQASGDDL